MTGPVVFSLLTLLATILQLVALARYHDAVDFGVAGALSIVFLPGLVAFGLVGILAARRPAKAASAAGSTLSG